MKTALLLLVLVGCNQGPDCATRCGQAVFGVAACEGPQAAEDAVLGVWSRYRPDWPQGELCAALDGIRVEVLDGYIVAETQTDGRYTRSLRRIQLTRFGTWHESPYLHETAHLFGGILDGNSRQNHEGWWDAGFWPAELEGTRVAVSMAAPEP
jgi:hypothetical protein